MRFLAALVLLGLAALMLAGSIAEATRTRRQHIPTRIEQPREPEPLQRRRVSCEDPTWVELAWGCA